MKLSNPIAIKFVALLASWLLRGWLGTLDIRFDVAAAAGGIPARMNRKGLYLFWHESLLLPAYTHASRGFSILVSTHRDGELISQVVRMLRGSAVRGSTTRGGTAAMLGMMRAKNAAHIAITPDGPRGPRRRVQQGAIFLASRAGLPLFPVGVAAANCWRTPSWDRMILPRPGQKAFYVLGEAIEIPPHADREQIEKYLPLVQAAMDDVQDRADKLAAGKKPTRPLMTLQQVTQTQGV